MKPLKRLVLNTKKADLEQLIGAASAGEQLTPQRQLGLAGTVRHRLQKFGEFLDERDDARQQRICNTHKLQLAIIPHRIPDLPRT